MHRAAQFPKGSKTGWSAARARGAGGAGGSSPQAFACLSTSRPASAPLSGLPIRIRRTNKDSGVPGKEALEFQQTRISLAPLAKSNPRFLDEARSATAEVVQAFGELKKIADEIDRRPAQVDAQLLEGLARHVRNFQHGCLQKASLEILDQQLDRVLKLTPPAEEKQLLSILFTLRDTVLRDDTKVGRFESVLTQARKGLQETGAGAGATPRQEGSRDRPPASGLVEKLRQAVGLRHRAADFLRGKLGLSGGASAADGRLGKASTARRDLQEAEAFQHQIVAICDKLLTALYAFEVQRTARANAIAAEERSARRVQRRAERLAARAALAPASASAASHLGAAPRSST